MKILFASLFIVVLLAGCGSAAVLNGHTGDYPTEETTTEYTTTEEDTTIVETTTDIPPHTTPLPPPVIQNDLVWRAAPTMEFANMHNCCDMFYGFDENWRNVRFVDPIAGYITAGGWRCEHGAMYVPHWIDPERQRVGSDFGPGYFGLEMFTYEEFTQSWSYQQGGLRLVHRANTSQMTFDQWGAGTIPEQAISEKVAVARGTTLLTDFIFDRVHHHTSTSGNTIVVHQGDRWGIVDHRGDTIIPLMFEHIVRIDDETAFARHNGRYGILDITATARNF